jgi:hypothetical protein
MSKPGWLIGLVKFQCSEFRTMDKASEEKGMFESWELSSDYGAGTMRERRMET